MKVKKTLQTIAIVIGLASIASQDLLAASFDCGRVSNSTESAICSFPQIGRMDEKMVSLYEKVSNISRVKQEQRDWIRYRNRECGDNEQCLKAIYTKRISELKRLTHDSNDAHRDTSSIRSPRASRESRASKPSRVSRESRSSRSTRSSRDIRPVRPDSGSNIFSPEKGIVCDRASGFCADHQGISMGFTQEYLGEEAASEFKKNIERDQIDTARFTMSNGIYCDATVQKCYKSSLEDQVDNYYSHRMFLR